MSHVQKLHYPRNYNIVFVQQTEDSTRVQEIPSELSWVLSKDSLNVEISLRLINFWGCRKVLHWSESRVHEEQAGATLLFCGTVKDSQAVDPSREWGCIRRHSGSFKTLFTHLASNDTGATKTKKNSLLKVSSLQLSALLFTSCFSSSLEQFDSWFCSFHITFFSIIITNITFLLFSSVVLFITCSIEFLQFFHVCVCLYVWVNVPVLCFLLWSLKLSRSFCSQQPRDDESSAAGRRGPDTSGSSLLCTLSFSLISFVCFLLVFLFFVSLFIPSSPLCPPSSSRLKCFVIGCCSLPGASRWSSFLCPWRRCLLWAPAGSSWAPAGRRESPPTRGSSVLHKHRYQINTVSKKYYILCICSLIFGITLHLVKSHNWEKSWFRNMDNLMAIWRKIWSFQISDVWNFYYCSSFTN